MNYQVQLDNLINNLKGKPRLLLHACCGPCSSYVLEYLQSHFDITILFYNPNIDTEEEYITRLKELKRLIKEMNLDIKVLSVGYDNGTFLEMAKGLEEEKEGGKRCFKCYHLRLKEAASLAKENNFDYFGTTLSISPYKNAHKLNEIGLELEKEYGIKYLVSDFKKKDGYKRSIELSEKYHLYRQKYCGCIYSKQKSSVN